MNEPQTVSMNQKFGRTWADLIFSAWGFIVIGLVVAVLYWWSPWDDLPRIPAWIFIAGMMSIIFTPFLVARAKDDSTLVLVSSGPTELTEYRVGKKYPFQIEGTSLNLNSVTGAKRILVTSFDPESGAATGTAFEGFTTFDIARDLGAFRRLSEAFVENVRSDRVHREMIGVEVESRVREYSDQWLRMLYGSLSMVEVEDALGIEPVNHPEIEPDAEDLRIDEE